MNINPGNPLAISAGGEYEACDVYFAGEQIAAAKVSQGANGSTIAFIDGSLTAKYGPGQYSFKFIRGNDVKEILTQSVHPWDHEDVDAIELPELTGVHGWLVLHERAPEPQPLPEINLSVQTNTVSRRMAALVVACVAGVELVISLLRLLEGS